MLPCGMMRVAREDRLEEGERVGVVLEPARERRDRDVLRRGLERRVRAGDRRDVEGDADLRGVRLDDRQHPLVGEAVSTSRSTSWQAAALHMPSCFVSYFEPFIAPLAFARLAVVAGRGVRVVLGELVVEDRVGDDVARDLADERPAPDLAERGLVDDPVHRPRTWMSSNGGWVRFIVMYSTRSAGLR